MMDKAAIVSVFISLVTANSIVEFKQDMTPWKAPKFCNKLDCPAYTVVKDYKTFQERQYEESSWVTTSMTGVDYDEAQYKMFMKLFNYINGANEKKVKIAMTCPVKVRIIPGEGPTCASNFTMSFFVPPKESVQVPKPTDPSLYLEKIPPKTYYVASFGGYASDYLDWAKHAAQLSEDLSKASLKDYVTGHYYTCGYDSPWKFWLRHNEIWFVQNDGESNLLD